MNKMTEIRVLSAVALVATSFLALPAHAQQAGASDIVNVNINVMPFAMLEFDDPDPLLYLEVPPPDSTLPATGVGFTVIGNSNATLSAEPDAFMQIPAANYSVSVPYDPHLGRAEQGGQFIGYDIELRFPANSINGLPLENEGAAESGPVDIIGAGGAVGGVLHLIADPNYTSDGGLALPGLYEGEIILTLTAS